MFSNFTEEAREVMVLAKKEMIDLKHPYVGSEHLLLAILKHENEVSDKLSDYKVTYTQMRMEIIDIIGYGKEENTLFLYTPLLKRILENAIIDSKENNHGEVTVSHLFTGILEEGEGVAIRILLGMGVDLDELYHDFSYKLIGKKKGKKKGKLFLEEIGTDITKLALEGKLDPAIGRDKELAKVMEILSRRTKNNPVLIGEAGVGKTAIVEELAREIVNGDVPESLLNKRIISLDMGSSVAGTKYRGEFEDRMRKILKEVEENEDIILFIDEIHTLVGAGGAEGAIDASNIFKPALARGHLRCIGATTTSEYKKYIEEDSALERRFQKVSVLKPTKETVLSILHTLKPIYESFHHVTVEEEALLEIVRLTDRYIFDRNEPDRSIDVLDEVCAKVSLSLTKEGKKYHEIHKKLKDISFKKKEAIMRSDFDTAIALKAEENKIQGILNEMDLKGVPIKNKSVSVKDVAKVIHEKTSVPIYEIEREDKRVLASMEKLLHKQIIGQEEAILKVMQIAKTRKLGFCDDGKCYSLLFTGPSGTGKTFLAKLFAKSLVGEENIIKLDMSEYNEAHSVSKIIGSPPGYVGYKENKNVLDEIKNKPYSVVILDEIEKAHHSVLDLFYQILDDGKIKSAAGKEVSFHHVLIIMTSNIGFHDIQIGFSKGDKTVSKLQDNFSIPFMNRIDHVVTFQSLSKDAILSIIHSSLQRLKQKYLKKNVKVSFGNKVVEELLSFTQYEMYGARKVEKVIKDKVETFLIEKIISGEDNVKIKTVCQNIPS